MPVLCVALPELTPWQHAPARVSGSVAIVAGNFQFSAPEGSRCCRLEGAKGFPTVSGKGKARMLPATGFAGASITTCSGLKRLLSSFEAYSAQGVPIGGRDLRHIWIFEPDWGIFSEIQPIPGVIKWQSLDVRPVLFGENMMQIRSRFWGVSGDGISTSAPDGKNT